MKNVLVINSGSSSIKYQLFQMPSPLPVCTGLIEKIGQPDSVITHKVYHTGGEKTTEINKAVAGHEEGMLEAARLLTAPGTGVLQNPQQVDIVGHRIVQGGEKLTETTIITTEVKAEIKRLFVLAPLHNPGHYKGIEVAEKVFTAATQVAVFDTTFHQTMPEKAWRYAIPDSLYKDFGIRAYGFHGTSHKYVSEQAMAYLDNPGAKIITLHLGNGCSMAAVNAGRCIDTSMGLTPLDGLVMGTRSGTIDPSVLLYLIAQQGYTADQLSELLNKKSGMLGLTGKSDMRDISQMMNNGDKAAKMAYEMYAYRIKKFIGAYIAALGGLNALVFTGGVGENDKLIREMICHEMDFFGIRLDGMKNKAANKDTREINASDTAVKILVIPTNEELEIANQCMALLHPAV